MVTYSDLFQLLTFLVAFADLIYQISKQKKMTAQLPTCAVKFF